MHAQQLMTPDPVTIRPQATLRQAVSLLQDLDVRHLPVVDDEGQLVGMLSDRDLRALTMPFLVDAETIGSVSASLTAPVSSIMSADVLSVQPEANVSEVVELMLEHKVGAVPVVDRDDGLVGIVSYVDVLRSLDLEPEED